MSTAAGAAAPCPRADITGVVLAGGRATRMGGVDKGLIMLNGRSMAELIVNALRPQVAEVLINANRSHQHYAELGCRLVSDTLSGYLGPLAGMASAMQAATTEFILAVPCDSPLIGPDIAQRLYAALTREQADIAVAHDGKRMHPVFALLRRSLLPSLLDYLNAGDRKIDLWFARHRTAVADFSDCPEAFLNVNTPDDHGELEERMRGAGAC